MQLRNKANRLLKVIHRLQRSQPLFVALQVLSLLLNFAVEGALVLQQRLDVLLCTLQLAGDGADGAGYMIFDFFEVGVARECMLPCEAKLLLSAEQLVQRCPALRQLTSGFANGADFTRSAEK
jgi:hypothetical protein